MWVMVAQRKGAADTMARLIDYGMLAGGIAERKGVASRKYMGVTYGASQITLARLEPPKERGGKE